MTLAMCFVFESKTADVSLDTQSQTMMTAFSAPPLFLLIGFTVSFALSKTDLEKKNGKCGNVFHGVDCEMAFHFSQFEDVSSMSARSTNAQLFSCWPQKRTKNDTCSALANDKQDLWPPSTHQVEDSDSHLHQTAVLKTIQPILTFSKQIKTLSKCSKPFIKTFLIHYQQWPL